MARNNPEASLAHAAMAALDAQQYADLPEWVRPGKQCWVISWADSSAVQACYKAEIVKILKRDVVVHYVARGNPVDERVARDTLARYGAMGRGGAKLLPLDSVEAANVRAVVWARSAARTVEKVADGYGHSVTRGVQRKPLESVADALALLDDAEKALRAIRANIVRSCVPWMSGDIDPQDGA